MIRTKEQAGVKRNSSVRIKSYELFMALPGPEDVKKPNVEISGKNFNAVKSGIFFQLGQKSGDSVSI